MSHTNAETFLRYLALLALFGATGFLFGALNAPLNSAASGQQASVQEALIPEPKFIAPTLTADAAYVFDIANNTTIFAHNEESQLPLASVTKVALALLADEYLDDDTIITLSERALRVEGDSGFTIGESWRVRDLLDFVLMTSSNDGAAAIAEEIESVAGVDIATLLNEHANTHSLSQTYFINETGLDSNELFSGAYGSAQDVGKLFTHAYTTAPELLAATAQPERTFANLAGDTYDAVNTNKALSDLPGLVFGKTGFTDLAGGNLAVLIETEPGHPFVIVVLASTLEERFVDVVTLTHALLNMHTQ